jgi:hypothetical protein
VLKNTDGSDRTSAETALTVVKNQCDTENNPDCDDDNGDDTFEQTSPEQNHTFKDSAGPALTGVFDPALLTAAAKIGAKVGGYLMLLDKPHYPFSRVGKKGWKVIMKDLSGGRKFTGKLQQTMNDEDWGAPIDTAFVTSIFITSPPPGSEFSIGDSFKVSGTATPNVNTGNPSIAILAGSTALPAHFSDDTPLKGGAAYICPAVANSDGNWGCPSNTKTTDQGAFSLYAAQYQPDRKGGWDQIDQTMRQYSVRVTPVTITSPVAGTTDATPFKVSGTGETGTRIVVPSLGSNASCKTDVTDGKWTCGDNYRLSTGTYNLMVYQYPANSSVAPTSTASLSFSIDDGTAGAPVAVGPWSTGTPPATTAYVDWMYQRYAFVPLQGTAAPGTTLCVDTIVLTTPCNDGLAIKAKASGTWSAPYALPTRYTGTFPLVITAFDAKGTVQSVYKTSYAVSVHGQTPVAFTSLVNAATYTSTDELVIHGIGQPGASICLGSGVQATPCTGGDSIPVDDQGRWSGPAPSKALGNYHLVATAFAGGSIQSSTQVNYAIAATTGTDVSVTSPQDRDTYKLKQTIQVSGMAKPNSDICISDTVPAKDCETPLHHVNGQGHWSAASLWLDTAGTYELVATMFEGSNPTSHMALSYQGADPDDDTQSVQITAPNNGIAYAQGEQVSVQGKGQSGTTVCISDKAILTKPTQSCVTVNNKAWSSGSSYKVPTNEPGMHRLYVAQFDNETLISSQAVTFWVLKPETRH